MRRWLQGECLRSDFPVPRPPLTSFVVGAIPFGSPHPPSREPKKFESPYNLPLSSL
jgi:hypothetical protein